MATQTRDPANLVWLWISNIAVLLGAERRREEARP